MRPALFVFAFLCVTLPFDALTFAQGPEPVEGWDGRPTSEPPPPALSKVEGCALCQCFQSYGRSLYHEDTRYSFPGRTPFSTIHPQKNASSSRSLTIVNDFLRDRVRITLIEIELSQL